MDFLASVQAPLGVVAVAGMYRTGKSYLLNRIILDRSSGFGVGPSVNPCTKGLWVWGRPLSALSTDGDPCSVIVVDSEGVGALDGDEDHDARIFALAMLISSFFIYNSTGSIDESALQSVSFIANITKHIHVKSSGDSPADFSSYFPKFMWVVRDFTLQLIRQEGGACSAKDYLEIALEVQKSTNEQTEERNKVRTALKSFFKDRDCFTLVRPVANESDLQRLDGKELTDLRPEFVQQVMTLRRKVMTGVSIKTMHGRAMTGEMLSGLLHSYTKAINEGVVPSIESAWTYISQGECEKALQEAIGIYTNIITKGMENNFPMLEEELKVLHRDAKSTALQSFDFKAFGDDKESYLRTLRVKMSQTLTNIRQQNEEIGLKLATQFLEETYQTIENKVKSGEFGSVLDYEKDLRAFQQYFLQHGPLGPMRNEVLYKFCLDEYGTAADLFLKNINNELLVSTQLKDDQIQRLQTELREGKEQANKDIDALQRKLSGSEADKAEAVAREQTLQMQVNDLRVARDKTERDLRDAAKTMKVELSRQLEDLKSQKSLAEDSIKELEHRIHLGDSEIEQERALNKQRIEYLEKTLQEAESREKEFQAEVTTLRKEHNSTLRDVQSKLDQQLKAALSKFESASEKSSDLENQLALKETEIEKVQIASQQEIKSLNELLTESKRQSAQYQHQLELKETESFARFKELYDNTEGLENKLQGKISESDRKAKQAAIELQALKQSSAKDTEVLTQKIDFLTQQLEETNQQLAIEKKLHETVFGALKPTDSKSDSGAENEVQSLLEKHKTEIHSLKQGFEDIRERLNATVEELRDKCSDLELKLKLEQSDRESNEKLYSEKLTTALEEKAKFAENLKTMQNARAGLAEDEANKYKSAIKDLERQMEEQRLKANSEIKAVNDQAEATLNQLRECFNDKEQQLRQGLIEEKARAERRFTAMVEEMEEKMREDSEVNADHIDELEAELSRQEVSYQERLNELTQRSALDQQKINTLEQHLKDTKESLSGIHSSNAGALQQHLDSFSKERISLQEKIERLNSDLAKRDREQSALVYKAEYLEKAQNAREREVEELRNELERDKKALTEKLEDAKQKNRQLADDVLQKKSSYKQELALANQHIEFQSKKIADLERLLQDAKRQHSDSMKTLRDENEVELSEKMTQLIEDRDTFKREAEARLREVKEVESSCARQLASVEREKSVLAEKLASFESRRVEGEAKLRQDLAQLQAQLKEKREIEGPDKVTLRTENDRLKGLISDLEREIAEKKNLLDRDKLLYENRFNFLTQQKDNAKAALDEAQRKFELTLDELRRRSLADKEKTESTTASLLASVENRFLMQIKELKETASNKQRELEETKAATDLKIKSLKEQLETERRSRTNDSGGRERKVQELMESEQKLAQELEMCRTDRDRKLTELTNNFESEKKQLSLRLSECEHRAKEAEQQRATMYLEHEKERVKWAVERDQIVAQRNEAQDKVERSAKRIETQLREIDKLKVDRSAQARLMNMVARREAGPKPGVSILGTSIAVEEGNTSAYTSAEAATPNTSSSDVSPLHSRKRSYNGPRAISPIGRKETPSRIDSGRARYGDNR